MPRKRPVAPWVEWTPDPSLSVAENQADYESWLAAAQERTTPRDVLDLGSANLRNYVDASVKQTAPAKAPSPPKTSRSSTGQVEVPFIVPASQLSGPGNRSSLDPPISTTHVVGDPGIVPPSNTPIAPIAGFVPPNVGSATAPVTGPDMWRWQESAARAAAAAAQPQANIPAPAPMPAAGSGSSSVTIPMPPPLMGPPPPPANQQGQAPAKQPPLDPLKVMSDQPTQQDLAKKAASRRILPPQHAQPQPQSPVPAAPAPAQQQPVAGILPPMANSVFPNFGIQPQQSFDLQGTPATAVGDTNATAMQLDPANLAVLGQSLGSSSPASAAMNPAAIQALARMGQGVVQSNNPQIVPANPRPVEMPGRASVSIGNDADKILALILARSQGQAVPGLSQLVGKL